MQSIAQRHSGIDGIPLHAIQGKVAEAFMPRQVRVLLVMKPSLRWLFGIEQSVLLLHEVACVQPRNAFGNATQLTMSATAFGNSKLLRDSSLSSAFPLTTAVDDQGVCLQFVERKLAGFGWLQDEQVTFIA